MKLIKISPQFQITIPKSCRYLCRSGWFAMTVEDRVITLRAVDIQEAKTEEEVIEEFLSASKWRREGDSNPR